MLVVPSFAPSCGWIVAAAVGCRAVGSGIVARVAIAGRVRLVVQKIKEDLGDTECRDLAKLISAK